MDPQTAARVAAHVEANARRYFPDLTGPCRIVERSIHASSHPIACFELRFAGATRRVIAKRGEVHPTNNESRAEFENFTLFNARNVVPDVHCPRALDFLEGENVVITEAVSGENLLGLWRRVSTSPWARPDGRMKGLIRLSARWLRSFHEIRSTVHASPMSSADLGALRSYQAKLSAGERSITGAGTYTLGPEVHSKLSAVLDALEADRDGILHAYGTPHRDFGTGNILAHGGSITVIDASSSEQHPLLIDVTYFLVTLSAVKTFGFGGDAASAGYAGEFLDAYFGADRERIVSSLSFSILRLRSLLLQAIRHMERARRLPFPASAVTLRYFKLGYSSEILASLAAIEGKRLAAHRSPRSCLWSIAGGAAAPLAQDAGGQAQEIL